MFKKTSLVVLALILSISIFAVGCGQKEAPAPAEKPAEATLSGNIKLAGSTSVQPLAEELAMAFMEINKDVKIDVAGGGSGAGVESAANGAADIGMASRKVKDSEREATPELKDIAIALDGITVIVHNDNEVSELSLEQVAGIYSGEITNWSEVGGADVTITVVNREEGSGTRGAFEEIVLGKVPYTDKAVIQNSTGAVKTAVAADVNAIGYISMGSMSDDVKGIIVDGEEPSTANVLNGSYPISRPFNFLILGDGTELGQAFIEWIMSPAGQEIVAKEKYIPVK